MFTLQSQLSPSLFRSLFNWYVLSVGDLWSDLSIKLFSQMEISVPEEAASWLNSVLSSFRNSTFHFNATLIMTGAVVSRIGVARHLNPLYLSCIFSLSFDQVFLTGRQQNAEQESVAEHIYWVCLTNYLRELQLQLATSNHPNLTVPVMPVQMYFIHYMAMCFKTLLLTYSYYLKD